MILAVANQKGGVGKTTTAVTVGAYFARQGRRTLIVDTDSQGHVALALGLAKSDGLYQTLVNGRAVHQAAVEARANLDILPNDHTAELVKERFARASFREFLIAEALERTSYDLIVLDTPPSTDALHVATLVAADTLIIPAKMDYLALDGATSILATTAHLGRFAGVTPPRVIGVLPTLFDRSTNETAENVRRLQGALGVDMLLPPIPQDTRIREAASYGQTIWEFAPGCSGVCGYEGSGSRVRNSLGRVGGYLHLVEMVEQLMGPSAALRPAPNKKGS